MGIPRQLPWLACLSLLWFSACDTTQSNRSYSNPGITASPYSRVGTLTHIDLASATVIVRLDRIDSELNTELFTRNPQMKLTASLRPTGIRTGNSVGMVIVSGEPAIGQEVVQKLQP